MGGIGSSSGPILHKLQRTLQDPPLKPPAGHWCVPVFVAISSIRVTLTRTASRTAGLVSSCAQAARASRPRLINFMECLFMLHLCRDPCSKFYFLAAQDLISCDQFKKSVSNKLQRFSRTPMASCSRCTFPLNSCPFWNGDHTCKLVTTLPSESDVRHIFYSHPFYSVLMAHHFCLLTTPMPTLTLNLNPLTPMSLIVLSISPKQPGRFAEIGHRHRQVPPRMTPPISQAGQSSDSSH